MERKTRIVATMGPACESAEAVRGLVEAGMNVARLNFSHGEPDTHRRFAEWVRAAGAETGRAVAILQDIQGPKIRTGTFPGGRALLRADDRVDVRPGSGAGDASTVFVGYEPLAEDVRPGESIVLADGQVRLRVESVFEDRLTARVVEGGVVGDRKGVAFPESTLSTPALTEKDRADLELGRELGVDFVAASFVRHGDDVRRVASLCGVPVIAKVELAIAYENLDEILAASHGVMVARGDLGVELPLQRIPTVQADILERTNQTGTISVTATEMLESMTDNHRPTRAEVTDVTAAVLSGTDAVMLSGETAVGRHPRRVIEAMDVICREAESQRGSIFRREGLLTDEEPFPSATAKAAVEAARELGLGTIVAFTESGSTARLISKYRPAARIVAFTPFEATRRRMAAYWGVLPLEFDRLESTDEMMELAERELLARRLAGPGERVVMVAGVPPNRKHSTNLMKLHRLPG